MKWAVVNEIGNEEKRVETTYIEADTPTTAMMEKFSRTALDMISNGESHFEEESTTIGVYEAFELEDGTFLQGDYNHLNAINAKNDLASHMQKLLDAEKEKNEKYLLFDGSNFVQPNKGFQKEWGIRKLDLELTEDGQIKTQGVSRYASARCVHWEKAENEGEG